MTQTLNTNRKYTFKRFQGQLITDDRWEDRGHRGRPIDDNMTIQRELLVGLCDEAGIELKLCDPYPLQFPDETGERDHTNQIRSTFYVSGNYPVWYFYQTVNQVRPMALDKAY